MRASVALPAVASKLIVSSVPSVTVAVLTVAVAKWTPLELICPLPVFTVMLPMSPIEISSAASLLAVIWIVSDPPSQLPSVSLAMAAASITTGLPLLSPSV